MTIHLFKRTLAKCGQEISVNNRSLGPSGFDSAQPNVGLTEIATPNAIVKTIESVRGGSKLFSGIQIDSAATHGFCVLYTAGLAAVERDNYFITLKSKSYRVLAVTNINEKDKILVIQATERGDSSKEASEA